MKDSSEPRMGMEWLRNAGSQMLPKMFMRSSSGLVVMSDVRVGTDMLAGEVDVAMSIDE